ncbi:hypothetical protein AXF42_Ash017300 [Apostasia shenzhenica]|uniref:Uncharacterized protein n=1 Tax=Apostasia shenzhenica TaxID=1088818 RepID=A0A2H9ZVM2_9ASPA|nr:hypothetical protein AXF42_Ash017300 [Apostasia shenzhenica]
MCGAYSSSCSSSVATGAGAGGDFYQPLTAKVIDVDGSLKEYPSTARAAGVLGLRHPSFVLCNADGFFFDRFIRATGSNQLLEPGMLYFVLPAARLEYPLAAEDMVTLAVKASSAIDAAARGSRKVMMGKKSWGWRWSRRRRKEVQILPVMAGVEDDGYRRINEASVGSWKTGKIDGDIAANKKLTRPRLSALEEEGN